MDGTPSARGAFGRLLRRYRELAGLRQERLAERAGLSAAAVSNLERGVNQPRLETVSLLADALALEPDQRATFLRAARPEQRANTPAHASEREIETRQNLPVSSTALLGREQEVAAVLEHLGQPAVRVLTLVGAGGIGKTRLAVAASAALLPHYPHGVWLVELAPVSDPGLAPSAVAGVLNVREDRDRPLVATLVDVLAAKTLLLVLDNCEHLLGACAGLVSNLLRACPHVTILATSRERLGVAGEQLYRVPPLAVPAPEHPAAIEEIGCSGAVQLFLARAQAQRPDFVLTAETAHSLWRSAEDWTASRSPLSWQQPELGGCRLRSLLRGWMRASVY